MSILREIQTLVMEKNQDISSILLKLRFLASRLGSTPLEEWVKYESEGYPEEVEVPPYRKIGVIYKATFSGPLGSGIKNAQIPDYLIEKYAGEKWVKYEIRQSIASIDELAKSKTDSNELHIDASNLILLLTGKVYKGYSCIEANGSIPFSTLSDIQHAIRARILELTIQLEKTSPIAAEIIVGPENIKNKMETEKSTSHITNQVIYGNYTNLHNQGDHNNIQITNSTKDIQSFVRTLTDAGISKSDAIDLSNLVKSEEPESQKEPLGTKAKSWLLKNINKAVDGTWKAGLSVASTVITQAALNYYGLK